MDNLKNLSEPVRIQRSGIEFKSREPIPEWTELALEFDPTHDAERINCTGVVVACNPDSDKGYLVLVTFINPPKQATSNLMKLQQA
jgi:hypothetical protein